jgi:hypothetical protein
VALKRGAASVGDELFSDSKNTIASGRRGMIKEEKQFNTQPAGFNRTSW